MRYKGFIWLRKYYLRLLFTFFLISMVMLQWQALNVQGPFYAPQLLLIIFISGLGWAATLGQNINLKHKLESIRYLNERGEMDQMSKKHLRQMISDVLGDKKGTEE